MTPDAIVSEVVRHRLHAINDEAATTLKRVSGSPIAVESNDLNTVITAADGRVVACGNYILAQVVSMHLVIEHLLTEYADNPGIGPGDQFITNDPYLGTLHQPDVVVVAPIFHDGRLVAWSGSVVHQMDVGGPTPGGISYGARSVFDEALPMPPLRIVEGGRIRRDIEREYLSRSRTPEFNALDLAGQVAANQRAAEQVQALCDRYGTQVVTSVMERLLDSAERLVRERLASLPDGRWRHVSYLEYAPRGDDAGDGDVYDDGDIYEVHLTMTKVGDELELDFSASSDQAPGAINAGYGALANYTIASVLVHLCAGLPWVPGGVAQAVRIVSRPGTVVHAQWPAGVAMSTGSTVHAIRACVNACLGRLLQADEELFEYVMAGCQSAGAAGGIISGRDRHGAVFTTMTLDELTGGGGARSTSDGLDASGTTTSPGALCMNVEVLESYFPLRYRRRDLLPDSGGPGAFRGGVGTVHVFGPHGTPHPISVLSFGQGLQHSGAVSLSGGEPGAQSLVAVLPEADAGRLLDGASAGLSLPVAQQGVELFGDLVHVGGTQGGGGFGDPIERDLDRVVVDVRSGVVTPAGAARDYAVTVVERDGTWVVDEDATSKLRAERRRDRLGGREPRPAVEVAATPLDHAFAIAGDDVVCRRCGSTLCGVGGDLYGRLVVENRSVAQGAPFGVTYAGSERFVLRSLFCPACGRQVDSQVARVDAPLVRAVEPGSRSRGEQQ